MMMVEPLKGFLWKCVNSVDKQTYCQSKDNSLNQDLLGEDASEFPNFAADHLSLIFPSKKANRILNSHCMKNSAISANLLPTCSTSLKKYYINSL
jgi:hypothetical protein